MASMVVKTAVKKLLGKKLQEKFGQGDPYYEKVPGVKSNGKPTGKQVKKKRALPPGLSDHDAKVLMRVRRRVHHLDWSLFTVFGVGFGWSTVIGIIPVIGDAIDGLMSLSVFRKCCKIEGGLPNSVKAHMMVNVALDFLIGLVPGAEAIFRGNTRNALLLESFLRERAEHNVHKLDQDAAQGLEPRRRGRGTRLPEDGIITPEESLERRPNGRKRSGPL
ncbi:uncharacterized protein UV8b_06387 [Ustilaginoidea virens]|uniref:Uncharacterized protein n=1 Tax=Ustilaginoidea virens TaxID=1159556 RepID=A0A063CEQ8_USTVR|nr:uncharacterized protein UV8b_06387 [Ustilaginoidea virens]QUC22146.1 hypothetical protein UV8b_06387 [Ustilaginoidea virens]GAO16438.1 hypothetical protein UVI_02047990 [Ustilaginoidea virens]